MFMLTKLAVLWDKVAALEKGGGTGLPDIGPSDYGSYLAVDELGEWGLDRPKTCIDYKTIEQNTGLKWIDGRSIYQKTFSIAEMPNATTLTIPHGITGDFQLIKIIGACNSETFKFPIPHASFVINGIDYSIETYCDDVNIYIDTKTDRSNCTGTLTITYLKATETKKK